MSVFADSAGTTTVSSGAAVPTGQGSNYLPEFALWKFVLRDRLQNDLADISAIAFDKKLHRRLNRPAVATCRVPSGNALVYTIYGGDGWGDPYLAEGTRLLAVYQRATPSSPWVIVHQGVVWYLEEAGDENTVYTDITSMDPLAFWPMRPVRDSTGNLISPEFGDPISGPALVKAIALNSEQAGDGTAADCEGPLFLDIGGGDYDLSGVNMTPDKVMDWPFTMGDMLTMLTDTGLCDVWVDPIDSPGSNKIGRLNAKTTAGSDRPSIHFDYGLGDYSIAQIRRSKSVDSVCNKLWYYLGPRRSRDRWAGNITGTQTAAGGHTDMSDLVSLTSNSRSRYGVMMQIRIYDHIGAENTGRLLYERLWRQETTLRARSREMLYVTPKRNAIFGPQELKLGDVIRVNASSIIRQGFTNAAQRIYGYVTSIDDDAVQAIEELQTSAQEVG